MQLEACKNGFFWACWAHVYGRTMVAGGRLAFTIQERCYLTATNTMEAVAREKYCNT